MRGKTTEQRRGEPVLPSAYYTPPILGNLFKKQGAYDGKLFFAKKKITYTFIDGDQVIALHFDKARKHIFYKGHNIENIELGEQHKHHLELFRQEMAKDPKTQSFLNAYTQVLNQYLEEHR